MTNLLHPKNSPKALIIGSVFGLVVGAIVVGGVWVWQYKTAVYKAIKYKSIIEQIPDKSFEKAKSDMQKALKIALENQEAVNSTDFQKVVEVGQ